MRRAVVLQSAWKIAKAYWFSNDKWSAWGLLLVVIALNLGLVYISVLLNVWQGTFYQVLQNYNQAGFIRAVGNFTLLVVLLIIVRGYQVYTRMLLHIQWRSWLTEKYLADWLRYKTYYRLKLLANEEADNPDQRISEDVELFVSLTLRLSIDVLQDILTVSSFVVILWNLSGILYLPLGRFHLPVYGYLVWAALVYAAIGTYLTIRLGHPLVRLDYDQQRYEADFRFSLVRVRENAESIAFYNGEMQEKKTFLRHFENIVNNYLKIITVRKKLTWLTTTYSHASIIFGVLVASPRYFRNQIHLGQMFQVIDAYNHVQNGFSFVIDSFTRLAQWRAVVNRLNNFLIYMEIARAEASSSYQIEVSRQPRRGLTLKAINVFRPDGYNLIKNITLTLDSNESLLIIGPSGCGKSTFLRTLAGLWPYANGCIHVPDKKKVLFVPQKSYMPLTRFRDVLTYPGPTQPVEDAVLKKILLTCHLPHLIDRLEETLDWGQALSLGEQQRVAFVRILLLQPDWLFLDEATSALDENTEKVMYESLPQLLPHTSVISVGHRKTLLNYHRNRLELDGKGGWQLIPRFAKPV
ncbi:abc transporter [Lucifera butyrica]|uniref:Abc transporter n=1 Tax=Lucifera butyrica TaxID=1351585 RepID=A0A498RGA9_9FIRM|nr:ABC transporter ATP-binding protein/permease [Lucifera butyrica]VBB09112.1 abc transporter [Lucifera butyrica]